MPARTTQGAAARDVEVVSPDLGLQAWRAFLHAHAAVTDRLAAELESAHGLSLAHYDVLIQLANAPRRRLRMRGLAEAVLLSRSGLTRLIDRMELEGLVQREPCLGDARGVETVLTDAGLAVLIRAAPTHLAGVGRHVTALLTQAELQLLATVMARLATAAGRPVTGPTRGDPSSNSPESAPARGAGRCRPGPVTRGRPEPVV